MRVFFLPALLLVAPLARAAESELLFQPAAVAFGHQPQNQALAAEVKLTNPTAAPIVIKRVESDCDCTTGEVFPQRLAPGAEGHDAGHGREEGSRFKHFDPGQRRRENFAPPQFIAQREREKKTLERHFDASEPIA